MPAVLAGLLLQVAPPPIQGKREPIRDWSYVQKAVNPKTGREEITAEVAGEEATPIDLTPKREVFEVAGVSATYYMDPRPPRTGKVERILIRARRARMDNGAGVLRLHERVRVERPAAEEGATPTVLTAPEAVVTFRPEYLCSGCGYRDAAKGDCLHCLKPLSERMSVVVQAPRAFELSGPEGLIRGEGVVADEAMTDVAVERQGYLEVVGDPQALARPDAGRRDVPRRVVSQLACRGPLRIRELLPGLRSVTAREGVRLDRLDETGTQTALAERMTITLSSRADPATLRSAPVLERVEAAGDVRLSAVAFADGREISARADAMVLERDDFVDFAVTRLRLEGAPVEVASGASTVRADRVSLEQPFGAAHFEGGVDARLQGLAGGSAPVLLRSRSLAARLAPGGEDVETLEALGDVRLEGLLGGGRAAADRFVWDRAAAKGLLESPRLVRLEQGATLVLAPVVALQDAGRSVVLQGPKQIVFVQEREGGREVLRASCEGDIFYDAAAGRISMARDCRLRTADFRLSADRVDLRVDPVRRELAGFTARGDVRVRRDADSVLLSGNRLTYDPDGQEFRLRGSPSAVATRDRATITTEEIVLVERTDGQGRRVPVTELRGGEQGVRILIPGEPR